ASGPTSPYCTGDNKINADNTITDLLQKLPTTVFTVRGPDDSPWDNTNNPIITTCGGYTNPHSFLPYEGSLGQAIQRNLNGVGSSFRQWVPLCQVPAGSVQLGDYIIQVQTDGQTGTSTSPGAGHNRFSMRAGFVPGTGLPNSTGVSIFASG